MRDKAGDFNRVQAETADKIDLNVRLLWIMEHEYVIHKYSFGTPAIHKYSLGTLAIHKSEGRRMLKKVLSAVSSRRTKQELVQNVSLLWYLWNRGLKLPWWLILYNLYPNVPPSRK